MCGVNKELEALFVFGSILLFFVFVVGANYFVYRNSLKE